MLSAKSLRGEFALKLLPAISLLVFLFSYVVYSSIAKSIYSGIKQEMLEAAKQSVERFNNQESNVLYRGCSVEQVDTNSFETPLATFERSTVDGIEYMTLFYPYSHADSIGLKINRDITTSVELLRNIRNIIIVLNLLAIVVLIPSFAYTFSIFLARPIKNLSLELASMNENSLGDINRIRLPEEFKPLGKTLNRLLRRLEGHIGYQRELFTGIAHELKTPLAVIRAKNDVTLLKERTPEKYQEVLRLINRVVDEMNKMTGTVLDIGRAEYARFDKPEKINIIEFLNKKIDELKTLAEQEGKIVTANLKPDALMFMTQPTLITHIVQNLVANAIKFTPVGKTITISSYMEDGNFILKVEDEGVGIEDGVDLFAPFVGKGEHKGVGLGLYLANNAAQALNGSISLQNRIDGNGTVATLVLEYVKPNKKE